MMREHSKAYEEFIYQINAAPRIRYDGYDTGLLESIYPEEREEIEALILKLFEEGDYHLSCFIPKIESVNGVEMLEKALERSKVPSGKSQKIACALYQHTENERYLEIIAAPLKSSNKFDRIGAIVDLMRFRQTSEIYSIIKNVWLDESERIVRVQAATALLYNKGYIKDPFKIAPMSDELEDLENRLYNDDKNVRMQAIQELDKLE